MELRVHGVGGATPEGLLGLAPGAPTIQVAGDDRAGFHARPESPRVQGYVWSKLTRGAAVQALWILLLPFILFNVGNWMFPEPRAGPVGRASRFAERVTMSLIGLSLTVAYVLWEFAILAQLVAYRWSPLARRLDSLVAAGWVKAVLPEGWERPPVFRVLVGTAMVAAVGIAVSYMARRTRRDFEQVPSPVAAGQDRGPRNPFAVWFPTQEGQDLRSRSFWSHAGESSRLLGFHLAVGTAFFFFMAWWLMHQAGSSVPPAERLPDGSPMLSVRAVSLGLLRFQVIALGCCAALYWLGWRRGHQGWRFAAPAVVAVTSVALATGFFSGLVSLVGQKTGISGPILDLDVSEAFGLGSLAFVAAAAAWLGWHLIGARPERVALREEEWARPNTAPPGQEQNGLAEDMYRSVGRLRSFSHGIPHADLVLTTSALVFLVSATAAAWFHPQFPSWAPTIGRKVVGAGVAVVLPALIYRAYQPSSRSKVGTLWDTMTFWPRRFQPFAARPYAERSVPELQWRIRHLVETGQPVVVCAHSQGSVLAFAALIQLAEWCGDLTTRVSLVTFGSPLRRMYARFFPAIFRLELLDELRGKLFQRPEDPWIGWTNFYRRTDYIGQALYAEACVCDHELPDPPIEPELATMPLDRPYPAGTDQPAPVRIKPSVHSLYNNEVRLRARVAEVVDAMKAAGQGPVA